MSIDETIRSTPPHSTIVYKTRAEWNSVVDFAVANGMNISFTYMGREHKLDSTKV